MVNMGMLEAVRINIQIHPHFLAWLFDSYVSKKWLPRKAFNKTF